MTTTITPSQSRHMDQNDNQKPEINRIDQATASSAGSRINIPLNLENWKHLSPEHQSELTWFHQHALDAKLTLTEAAQALNYDTSTIFRILKGTYEGSWPNVMRAIAGYKKITLERRDIQRNSFVENSISKLIFAGLDYAMANNSITLVIGESRMGKSVSGLVWKERNNHGRSVWVVAPAYGGTKALLRDIAAAVGVNRNTSVPVMHESILRAFNKNRILIVDEAHRLLPSDRRSNPVNLEIIRDIHDRTGCAVALIATTRFDVELKKGEYMYEQVLGRIGMPVRLKKTIKESDIMGIIRQYIPKPSDSLVKAAVEVANNLGRLGILVELLKAASRIAAKQKTTLKDQHFFESLAIRKQMSGE